MKKLGEHRTENINENNCRKQAYAQQMNNDAVNSTILELANSAIASKL